MGTQAYFSKAGVNGEIPQAMRPLTEQEQSGKVVGEDSDMEEIEVEESFMRKA